MQHLGCQLVYSVRALLRARTHACLQMLSRATSRKAMLPFVFDDDDDGHTWRHRLLPCFRLVVFMLVGDFPQWAVLCSVDFLTSWHLVDRPARPSHSSDGLLIRKFFAVIVGPSKVAHRQIHRRTVSHPVPHDSLHPPSMTEHHERIPRPGIPVSRQQRWPPERGRSTTPPQQSSARKGCKHMLIADYVLLSSQSELRNQLRSDLDVQSRNDGC